MDLPEMLKLLFLHKDAMPTGAQIDICIQVNGRQVPLKSIGSKEVYREGETSFAIILHADMEKK